MGLPARHTNYTRVLSEQVAQLIKTIDDGNKRLEKAFLSQETKANTFTKEQLDSAWYQTRVKAAGLGYGWDDVYKVLTKELGL